MNINVIPTDSIIPKGKSLSTCQINCIHIQISDFNRIVHDFERSVTDTSWIAKLDPWGMMVLGTTAQKTIDKIVKDVIKKSKNRVTTDIGEYIISYTSQEALHVKFFHEKIPLAELLKERISGNPGFDFHTICVQKLLIFGESKFSLKSTPRAKALNQIIRFIDDRDKSEGFSLERFLDGQTKDNMLKGHRGYTAAFSFNNKGSITAVFEKALKSKAVKEIAKHKELYLIAVEIC
jgi:hypothetical protein